jgi:hypothetical protein
LKGLDVAKRKASSPSSGWFDNCGGRKPQHDLRELERGIEAGLVNAQDEYGMTALSLACLSNWQEGVERLLAAGADTELRYFRTGETALYMVVTQNRNESIISTLLANGANPDAPNYWGITPRIFAERIDLHCFDAIPVRETPRPPARIQNAEHLAEHFHPRFKIPSRQERETLKAGQAVVLYVYGPKSEGKQDTVKVRITAKAGRRPHVRYTAVVETEEDMVHLPPDVREVEFGPENVATVYVPRPAAKK